MSKTGPNDVSLRRDALRVLGDAGPGAELTRAEIQARLGLTHEMRLDRALRSLAADFLVRSRRDVVTVPFFFVDGVPTRSARCVATLYSLPAPPRRRRSK